MAASMQPALRSATLWAMSKLAYPVVLVACLAGCGDDEVSYSEPVGIHLAVSDGDVSGTTAIDEKNINTESGNPYGAFATAAREAVGGEPSRITVDGTTVAIAAGSDFSDLDAVFDGPVDISFVMNGSDVSYEVASGVVALGDGPGPLALEVLFDSDDLADADFSDLADGSFKVVLEGEVAEDFVGIGDTADLEAVFTFTAYE